MTCRLPEVISEECFGNTRGRVIVILQVLFADRQNTDEDADTGWRCLNPSESLSTLCPSAREPDWANERRLQVGVGVAQDAVQILLSFQRRQMGILPLTRSRMGACVCLARLNWMLTGLLIYLV